MCTCPVYRKNPAYVPHYKQYRYTVCKEMLARDNGDLPDPFSSPKTTFVNAHPHHIDVGTIRSDLDSAIHESTQYIRAKCGHCPECAAEKQAGLYQRVSSQSTTHYLYYFTLTVDDKHIPTVSLPYSGRTIKVTPWDDFTRMIKRIRKGNMFGREFSYIVFSELGSLHARPHFHGLICIPKEPGDTPTTSLKLESTVHRVLLNGWTRNVATTPVIQRRWREVTFKDYEVCFAFVERYVSWLRHVNPKFKGVHTSSIVRDYIYNSDGTVIVRFRQSDRVLRTKVNNRTPKYESMFNRTVRKWDPVKRVWIRPFDCHLLRPRSGDLAQSVSFYVTKYMTKDADVYSQMDDLLREEFTTPDGFFNETAYREYSLMVMPQCHKSLNFGVKFDPVKYQKYIRAIRVPGLTPSDRLTIAKSLRVPYRPVLDLIESCSRVSASDPNAEFVYYFDPANGQKSPLSRYYRDLVPRDVRVEMIDRVRRKHGQYIIYPTRTGSELLLKDISDRVKRDSALSFADVSDILAD